jgi:hypothetical protein
MPEAFFTSELLLASISNISSSSELLVWYKGLLFASISAIVSSSTESFLFKLLPS